MISWEDPELGITWYFTLLAAISFTLEPLCLIHMILGNGIPLALQVKLVEEPTLASTTLDTGFTSWALGGSKTKEEKWKDKNNKKFDKVHKYRHYYYIYY